MKTVMTKIAPKELTTKENKLCRQLYYDNVSVEIECFRTRKHYHVSCDVSPNGSRSYYLSRGSELSSGVISKFYEALVDPTLKAKFYINGVENELQDELKDEIISIYQQLRKYKW